MGMNDFHKFLDLLAESRIDEYKALMAANNNWPQYQKTFYESLIDLEQQIRLSEAGKYIYQGLGLVSHVLSTENGQSDTSKLRIINASRIVQNAGWWDGPHLGDVVNYAGKILKNDFPLVARQNAADAVKNALYFPGGHTESALNLVFEQQIGSIRKVSSLMKGFSYAVEHCPERLKTAEVEELLGRKSKSENIVIAHYAGKAYNALFGKQADIFRNL
jgi:hypothetical protein